MTFDAQIEAEGKREENANDAHQMPRLSTAVVEEACSCSVGFEADERGRDGIGHLSDEQQVAGRGVAEIDHTMVEDEQVGEPHRCAQIVENMTDTVGNFRSSADHIRLKSGRVHLREVRTKTKEETKKWTKNDDLAPREKLRIFGRFVITVGKTKQRDKRGPSNYYLHVTR